jgi:hypothetical protein
MGPCSATDSGSPQLSLVPYPEHAKPKYSLNMLVPWGDYLTISGGSLSLGPISLFGTFYRYDRVTASLRIRYPRILRGEGYNWYLYTCRLFYG